MKNNIKQKISLRERYNEILWHRRDAFVSRCYKESSGVCILMIIGIIFISMHPSHNGFLVAASLIILTVLYGIVIHFIWKSVDNAYATEIAENRRIKDELVDTYP